MRFILNGLKDDPDWEPFWSAYTMFKKVKEPANIDEMEDWMLDNERERRAKQDQNDVTHWRFPTHRNNNKRTNGDRGGRASDYDDKKAQGRTVQTEQSRRKNGNEQRGNRNATPATDRGQSGSPYYRGNTRQYIGQRNCNTSRSWYYDRRKQRPTEDRNVKHDARTQTENEKGLARLTQLAERLEAAMAANEQTDEDSGKLNSYVLDTGANPSYVRPGI